MPRPALSFLILTLIPILLAGFADHALSGDALVLGIAPTGPSAEGAAVLKAAYARLDIPVIFHRYPARRGLAEADAGMADGEAVRMDGLSRELPNLIQVRTPVASVQGVAVTCDPRLVIRDRADLVPLRVGVSPGILLSEELVRGLDHVIVGDWDRLFRMLYLDRLDVLIAYDGIERTQAGQPGAERLRVFRPRTWRAPLFHYLHRRHADLVPRIRAVLDDMRTSGEMDRLHARARAGKDLPDY